MYKLGINILSIKMYSRVPIPTIQLLICVRERSHNSIIYKLEDVAKNYTGLFQAFGEDKQHNVYQCMDLFLVIDASLLCYISQMIIASLQEHGWDQTLFY